MSPTSFRPGAVGREVAADQVRGGHRLLRRAGQRPALAPGDPGDVALTHDALHSLAVDPPVQPAQLGMDSRHPVGAPGGDVQDGDLVGQGVVGGPAGGAGLLAGRPGVKAGPGHFQQPAQQSNVVGGWFTTV